MRGARGRFSGVVTVGATAALLLTACGRGAESTASDTAPSLLRVGLPQFASQGMRQMVQIWTVELLATLTDEGRPRPSLAKDWTVIRTAGRSSSTCRHT